jgi:hypothetical protein
MEKLPPEILVKIFGNVLVNSPKKPCRQTSLSCRQTSLSCRQTSLSYPCKSCLNENFKKKIIEWNNILNVRLVCRYWNDVMDIIDDLPICDL